MAEPRSRSVRYLLGRRLQLAGESAAALPVLELLLAEDLPPAIAKETTRLAIEAAFALGRCDAVRRWAAASSALSDPPSTPAPPTGSSAAPSPSLKRGPVRSEPRHVACKISLRIGAFAGLRGRRVTIWQAGVFAPGHSV